MPFDGESCCFGFRLLTSGMISGIGLLCCIGTCASETTRMMACEKMSWLWRRDHCTQHTAVWGKLKWIGSRRTALYHHEWVFVQKITGKIKWKTSKQSTKDLTLQDLPSWSSDRKSENLATSYPPRDWLHFSLKLICLSSFLCFVFLFVDCLPRKDFSSLFSFFNPGYFLACHRFYPNN